MQHLPAIIGFLLVWLSHLATCKPPNIVFIISDDQDTRLGSLNYMPKVQKSIISEGVNSLNHFGTVALCCPARATLLRGQAAHNTNVTSVAGPAWVNTLHPTDLWVHVTKMVLEVPGPSFLPQAKIATTSHTGWRKPATQQHTSESAWTSMVVRIIKDHLPAGIGWIY